MIIIFKILNLRYTKRHCKDMFEVLMRKIHYLENCFWELIILSLRNGNRPYVVSSVDFQRLRLIEIFECRGSYNESQWDTNIVKIFLAIHIECQVQNSKSVLISKVCAKM